MAELYSEEKARSWLAANLASWETKEGRLHRSYTTPDWRVTLLVANAIAFLAEAAFHHPRLVLDYRSIEVQLTTHDAGGITEKDLELARKIEETVCWLQEESGPFSEPKLDWIRP